MSSAVFSVRMMRPQSGRAAALWTAAMAAGVADATFAGHASQPESAHRILIGDAIEFHHFWSSSQMAKAKPSTASPSPSATNNMARGSISGFSAMAPRAAEPIRPTA